jgi:hypothetical protein
MAIRKTVEETLVLAGARDVWLKNCRAAMESAGFSAIEVSPTLFQVTGKLRTFTVWGDLQITLLPEGASTRLVCRATAGVDNIWALFKSPTRTILTRFKTALDSA